MDRELLKYRLLTVILVFLMIVGLLISLFVEKAKTADYVPVNAKLIEIQKYYGSSFTNDMSLYRRQVFLFTMNGQEYTAEREVFSFSSWREGSTHTIRCNPNNPTELEDVKKKHTTIAVLAILCIAMITLLRSILVIHK